MVTNLHDGRPADRGGATARPAPTARRRARLVAAAALAVLLAVGVIAAVTAGPAEAADHVRVADALTDVDRDALEAAVDQARADGLELRVAVLADEPADGAIAEAERMVDRHGGTALVVTPAEVAGVSDDHDSPTVDAAVDAALEDLEQTDEDMASATTTFANELEPADDGGLPSALLLVGIVGGIVLLVRRSRRRRQRTLLGDGSGAGAEHHHHHYDDNAYSDGYSNRPRRPRAARSRARSGGHKSSRSRGGGGSRSRGSASRARSGGGSRGGGSRGSSSRRR